MQCIRAEVTLLCICCIYALWDLILQASKVFSYLRPERVLLFIEVTIIPWWSRFETDMKRILLLSACSSAKELQIISAPPIGYSLAKGPKGLFISKPVSKIRKVSKKCQHVNLLYTYTSRCIITFRNLLAGINYFCWFKLFLPLEQQMCILIGTKE